MLVFVEEHTLLLPYKYNIFYIKMQYVFEFNNTNLDLSNAHETYSHSALTLV